MLKPASQELLVAFYNIPSHIIQLLLPLFFRYAIQSETVEIATHRQRRVVAEGLPRPSVHGVAQSW